MTWKKKKQLSVCFILCSIPDAITLNVLKHMLSFVGDYLWMSLAGWDCLGGVVFVFVGFFALAACIYVPIKSEHL